MSDPQAAALPEGLARLLNGALRDHFRFFWARQPSDGTTTVRFGTEEMTLTTSVQAVTIRGRQPETLQHLLNTYHAYQLNVTHNGDSGWELVVKHPEGR